VGTGVAADVVGEGVFLALLLDATPAAVAVLEAGWATTGARARGLAPAVADTVATVSGAEVLAALPAVLTGVLLTGLS
jgi:hypothetical protein